MPVPGLRPARGPGPLSMSFVPSAALAPSPPCLSFIPRPPFHPVRTTRPSGFSVFLDDVRIPRDLHGSDQRLGGGTLGDVPVKRTVHELPASRRNPQVVGHVYPGQDRNAVPDLVETLGPGLDGIRSQTDPARLQRAVECAE